VAGHAPSRLDLLSKQYLSKAPRGLRDRAATSTPRNDALSPHGIGALASPYKSQTEQITQRPEKDAKKFELSFRALTVPFASFASSVRFDYAAPQELVCASHGLQYSHSNLTARGPPQ
jgi:hypothetical protein